MSTPEVLVRPVSYSVSVLPEFCVDHHIWSLTVDYRGRGLWAVLWGRQCLASDGSWDYEHIPSERHDDWLATHRFDLDTALRLAREHAPHV